jgi:DNA repair protein RadA
MGKNDDLESISGVGPSTAESFRENGYETIMSLAVASPGDLSSKTNVGESKASDIIQAAREVADIGGFDTGTEILEHRKKIGKIKFRIDAFDEMMGGGIETQSITEFYGEFGSGKSQFTHQLAVMAQLTPENGGAGGSAIFIDTEDSFRPERIREMVLGLEDDVIESEMEARGVDTEDDLVRDVLEHIDVANAFNTDHQILLAEKTMEIANRKAETDRPVRLLVVDSLTGHFRAEYVGRGELAPRQQKLNKHLHDLDRVGNVHNAAVIVANQVQSNPDAFFGDPTKPVGGNILGHKSTFRIYIRKSKGDKRVVKLVDAPNLPDAECVVRITGDGVVPE